MDSKEIKDQIKRMSDGPKRVLWPVRPHQDNAKVLTEIKAGLEKSLEAWNPLLNGIESGLIKEDWELISRMGKLVEGSLKKIEQILQADTGINLTKQILTCDCCHTQMSESKVCVLCHSHICNSCIGWDAMSKNTKQMVCKECAQLFEIPKEEN